MFLKLINLFFTDDKKIPFQCGGAHSVQIKDKNSKAEAVIFYRQPTSEELLQFVYIVLDTEESKFPELAKKTNQETPTQKTHEAMIKHKMIPSAKKVITHWTGYVNPEGQEIESIDELAKYYAHHLTAVVEHAFSAHEEFKKKS
jgi:hypothetical protein